MEPRIRKLLYATDLAGNTAHVFQMALVLSRRFSATVDILHVVEKLDNATNSWISAFVDPEIQASVRRERLETAEVQLEHRLNSMLDRFRDTEPDARARLGNRHIVGGYPANEILTVARAWNCDVIVLGTHGKGPLREAFLGGTARRVISRSRLPVFVIPVPRRP